MPVYEYRCDDCRRRSSLFYMTFSAASEATPTCSHCGSMHVRKLVSIFSSPKSDDARLDDLSDPAAFGDLDENDPKSVARWARKMGKELGEDLGPEYDEMVDAIERGEDPEGLAGMGGMGDGAEDDLDSFGGGSDDFS